MVDKENSNYTSLLEAFETVSELKMPPHLEAVAFEYLLRAPSSAPPAVRKSISAVETRDLGAISDLRAFIATTRPTSSVSEIPALLYWARINEGKETANERDVIELYRRAGMRPPKDVSQSFRDLCKKKYFRLEPAEGARGYYRLSRAGEDFVLHDLLTKDPD